MKRAWHLSAKFLTGFFVFAMYAMPQATISARPGVINYIEGQAFWNGQVISQQDIGPDVQLNSNDTLFTTSGKVEILLNPGAFLRLGDNTQIRMISPSLVDPQIEIGRGEAIVEIIQMVKGNQIQISDAGGSIILKNSGVYRITAGSQPAVAVYDGKAEVQLNGQTRSAGKKHEIILGAGLPEQSFDMNAVDDLYAWSTMRSEYEAAASLAARNTVVSNNNSGLLGLNNYFIPPYIPGWYWDSSWQSWAWLPGDGYFFSPFGWGFYSPSYVGYAPVVYTTVGGHYGGLPVNPKAPLAGGNMPRAPKNPSRVTTTAVNPQPLSAKALVGSARVTTNARVLSGLTRSFTANGSNMPSRSTNSTRSGEGNSSMPSRSGMASGSRSGSGSSTASRGSGGSSGGGGGHASSGGSSGGGSSSHK